ncbi:MAG: hypothetical protein ACFBSC_19825 [Microcoleaceae cyanobacterium]
MTQAADFFLNLGIFKQFYTEEIEIISEYLSVHRFYDLQEIMPQKEQRTSFGMILSGEVNVEDASLENPSRVAGDLLGEMALIYSETENPEFIAASDGAIAIITFDDIENLKLRYPYLAVKLVYLVTQSAIQQLYSQGLFTEQGGIVLFAEETLIDGLTGLVNHYQHSLADAPLYASQSICQALQQHPDLGLLPIPQLINPQALVGSHTLGSRILLGQIRAVVYLRESMEVLSEPAHLEAISRLCDLHSVLFTTNILVADLILKSIA